MSNRIRLHPTGSGTSFRMSYSSQREVLEMPGLFDMQRSSFQWFIDHGLQEVLDEFSPITNDQNGLSLSLAGCRICTDEIKDDIDRCREQGLTYAAPLRVRVRLYDKEHPEEVWEKKVKLCDLPIMTKDCTFIIHGSERVIVSQLVRSPGVYYERKTDKKGRDVFSCTAFPNRGAWLKYEMKQEDGLCVCINSTGKLVPVAVLLMALGRAFAREREDRQKNSGEHSAGVQPDYASDFATKEGILKIFGEDSSELKNSMDRVTGDKEAGKEAHPKTNSYKKWLNLLYQSCKGTGTDKTGGPFSEERAEDLIKNTFFDPRRYDLAAAGRYQFNKKLALRGRITGHILAEDVVDEANGDILGSAGETVTREMADEIQNAAIPYVWIQTEAGDRVKVLSNRMVDITHFVDCEPEELGITGEVYYPALRDILLQYQDNSDPEGLKDALTENAKELTPHSITVDDLLASISYCLNLRYGIGSVDDKDHLGNRRIRSVGELLQNEFRIGLRRMAWNIRGRLEKPDSAGKNSLKELLNGKSDNNKPLQAAVDRFFSISELSQLLQQENPLSEITQKRRLSSLGPGGLTRQNATYEARDVHYTHYGRICPIETPEGQNVGLINSLASFARINKFGFIEAPYRRIDQSDPERPRVTNDVVYMTADEEDNYHIALATTKLDDDGYIVDPSPYGRYRNEAFRYPKGLFEYMDASPQMAYSVAASLVPFLQNDDATRAMMGTNMQRQAVPLITAEAPVVGTGMEEKAARDSGLCIVAEKPGTAVFVDASIISVAYDDGTAEQFQLKKFCRTNQSGCYNQKPVISTGDHFEKGDILADGPGTEHGVLALGKNPLIGFMCWEGYNYEDAVLISERLVKDDVYTSVHIKEYDCDVHDGEKITRNLPDVVDEALKDLDEDGIIRIGAEVRPGDILVGRLTKVKEEQQNEAERLYIILSLGGNAIEVHNTSLRVPHEEYGIVVGTRTFTRGNGDELAPGVNKSVRIYIAQKRKISVGDKMAGRHGNKGVVSRILPVEDMPYLPNGRPLDIVLNPLGVPSRMNIGQVLELHLSLAAEVLGFNVTTPNFDGAAQDNVIDALNMANKYINSSWEDFEAEYKDKVDPEIMQYLHDHLDHREEWKGVPITPDGKVQLRDGRTGELFDNPTSIGFMHYMKLHHLVDDKIYARSTGSHSLVTQQPLGGKAQFGGQRFGEMEVWALEAYGAAHTLQEMLTVKSDDMSGRDRTYEAIVEGKNFPEAGEPESFHVLLKELKGLGLDVEVAGADETRSETRQVLNDHMAEYRALAANNLRDIDESNLRSDVGSSMIIQYPGMGGIVENAEDGKSDNPIEARVREFLNNAGPFISDGRLSHEDFDRLYQDYFDDLIESGEANEDDVIDQLADQGIVATARAEDGPDYENAEDNDDDPADAEGEEREVTAGEGDDADEEDDQDESGDEEIRLEEEISGKAPGMGHLTPEAVSELVHRVDDGRIAEKLLALIPDEPSSDRVCTEEDLYQALTEYLKSSKDGKGESLSEKYQKKTGEEYNINSEYGEKAAAFCGKTRTEIQSISEEGNAAAAELENAYSYLLQFEAGKRGGTAAELEGEAYKQYHDAIFEKFNYRLSNTLSSYLRTVIGNRLKDAVEADSNDTIKNAASLDVSKNTGDEGDPGSAGTKMDDLADDHQQTSEERLCWTEAKKKILELFTARERKVIRHKLKGRTEPEIAEKMHISPEEVEDIYEGIQKKAGEMDNYIMIMDIMKEYL